VTPDFQVAAGSSGAATRATPPLKRPALVAAAIAIVVAAVGGGLTEIGPWYQALKQPWWKPPDLAFGPAWTLIFGLTAASATLAYAYAPTAALRWRVIAAFLVNAVLNMLWSGLFFTAKRPDVALVEVVFLWASIVALIVVVRPISRTAGLLLLPYLAWVTFAAALNAEVVRLNAPF
jgi:translocator protein